MAPLDQAGDAASYDDPLSALTGANASYIADLVCPVLAKPVGG